MASIALAQVRAEDIIMDDYNEGTVSSVSDHGIQVRWEDGVWSYTWEEVREYGFTFKRA